MLTRRNALLIPAITTVSACSRLMLHTRMTGTADAAWISAYSDDRWFSLLLGPVAIIYVAIQTANDARETVWEITRPRTGNGLVRRVQYGVLPAGFAQVVAPHELAEGAGYELTLASSDYNDGVLYFTIENGRVQPGNA